jgi:hypothetical protein
LIVDKLSKTYDTLIEGFSQNPNIHYCGALPKRRDEISLPAMLLDLVELAPGRSAGTSELVLISHWEGRILLPDTEPVSALWQMVQQCLSWLETFEWKSIGVGDAHIKQAAPDHFSPDLQGHRCWLIEWTHQYRVGEDIWAQTGISPKIIDLGWRDDTDRETIYIHDESAL